MKRSMRIRSGLLSLSLLMVAAIVGGVGVGAASATTYNGPMFSTSPSSISAGASTNIVLADAQSGSWNYGGGEISNCGTSCSFTLEGCPTGVFMYYLVYQIRVVSPSGAQYALGSGNPGGTYDLAFPQSAGGPSGRTTAQGFGAAINITASDVLNIPFGVGTGVPFTLTTSTGTGTYAWFPVTGTSPSANPTSEVGTYNIDLEGKVLCGSNLLGFDIGGLTFTTAPLGAPSVSTQLSSSSIVAGGSVTDTATITGGNSPTGTITFNVYSGSTSSSCVGTPAAAQTVTLPAASATFSGLAAGSYEVQAVYSGDSNNAAASSPCGSEPLTVTSSNTVLTIAKTGVSNPADCSSITGAVGSVANGGPISYTVTVTNTGNTGAASVTVSDPQPSGETFGAASATSGTVTQAGSAGSWTWTGAIPAGGSVTITFTAIVSTSSTSVTNVATITSPSASATVVINGSPASCQTLVPQLTTSLSSSSIVAGSSVTDTASLSGVTASAGGSITFNVYSNSACSVLVSSSSAFPVSGPGTYGPATLSGLASGSYQVQAVYSGDSNNAGVTSACGSEPLTVTPPPQITLNIVKTGTSSPEGCSSATGAVGSLMNGGAIAYSVTVSNTGNTDATGVVVSDAQPSGESFGGAAATSGTITQSGGAGSWSWTGTIASGSSVTITWTAIVSTSSTSVTNVATITSPTASSTVTINGNPASCKTLVPQLATSLSSSSIVFGASVTDTATLSGVTTSPAATGTITFNVYSGSTSSSCTGTPAATQTVTLPTASATFSGLAAGSYEVQAVYSGDSNNAGASSPCGTEPLTVSGGGCNISNTIASNFNGGQIVSGNYIWFSAHIDLKTPTPSNGLTIRFTGQHISFTANGISYNLAVPDGSIVFSSAVSSASTTFTASATWVTTVPVSQTGDIFISALMFVPTTTLPGGINPVTWTGTFSTSTSQPLDLQWQWGAAVYTQPSGQPHFTGVATSDVAAYNSLNVKPVHEGLFTTSLFPTPHSNGDQAGTPENPAWQHGVTGGARGGGGSNWTGSWSATGEAKCP